MLVLSRHRGEDIYIDGKKITISVVDIRRDKVRLGIDAPREISIHRREVYEAIERDAAKLRQAEPLPRDGEAVP